MIDDEMQLFVIWVIALIFKGLKRASGCLAALVLLYIEARCIKLHSMI